MTYVLQEHSPQILDQKTATSAQKVPIHQSMGQLTAQTALQEDTLIIGGILPVRHVKVASIQIVLGPHIALTVMQVAHPLQVPHIVGKVVIPLILGHVPVHPARLVNLVMIPDRPIVFLVRLVVLQVQVPLLVPNVLLVLTQLVHHHPHAVNVLLEHMLPILEQLVVLLVMQDTILILEKLNV